MAECRRRSHGRGFRARCEWWNCLEAMGTAGAAAAPSGAWRVPAEHGGRSSSTSEVESRRRYSTGGLFGTTGSWFGGLRVYTRGWRSVSIRSTLSSRCRMPGVGRPDPKLSPLRDTRATTRTCATPRVATRSRSDLGRAGHHLFVEPTWNCWHRYARRLRACYPARGYKSGLGNHSATVRCSTRERTP